MTSGVLFSVMTIIAIVVGPVLAVIVTRYIDEARAGKARKMDIFRTLMRTRKMKVHVDHVGALNLVEVEFIDSNDVIKAWENYLKNLGEELPNIEDQGRYDDFRRRRDSLLTKLLSDIAKSLHLKVEQIKILEGNYIPRGWVDDDVEERSVRRHLLDVLSARAPLIVRVDNPVQAPNPYPPPPQVSNSSN